MHGPAEGGQGSLPEVARGDWETDSPGDSWRPWTVGWSGSSEHVEAKSRHES